MILSRRLLLYISSRDGGRPHFFLLLLLLFLHDQALTTFSRVPRRSIDRKQRKRDEGRRKGGDRSIDRSEILDRRGRPDQEVARPITDESGWSRSIVAQRERERERERKRDDVLESYLDKKGHPKDTPGSERRSRITIEHRLARLVSAPMLDFQTLPPKQSFVSFRVSRDAHRLHLRIRP